MHYEIMRQVQVARRTGASELDLTRNMYRVTQLPEAFTNWPQLRSLSLSNAGIRSLLPLKPLAGLEKLNLSYCRNVSELAPLTQLRALRELNLFRTRVRDLHPLSQLTSLRKLNLDGTGATDCKALAGLTRLETLNISNSKITDLTPLAGLQDLQALSLHNCEITDLSPLAGLRQLRRLDLYHTQVRDLTPLAGLAQLEALDLSHTPVTDLTPLAALGQLQHIALAGTQTPDWPNASHVHQGRWMDTDLDRHISTGDLENVRASVRRGAMIGAADWAGPMHHAIDRGDLDICRYLLSLDPELLNEVAFYDGVCPPDTPLALAILRKHAHITRFLLEAGADVTGADNRYEDAWFGGHHLACAVRVNDLALLEDLLERGAEIGARDDSGLTALHWAKARGTSATRRFLLDLWRAGQGLAALDEGAPVDEALDAALSEIGAPDGAYRYAESMSNF